MNNILWWGPCYRNGKTFSLKIIDEGYVSLVKAEILDDFNNWDFADYISTIGKTEPIGYTLEKFHLDTVKLRLVKKIKSDIETSKEKGNIDWTGINKNSNKIADPDIYFELNGVCDHLPIYIYNNPTNIVHEAIERIFQGNK